MNAAIIGGGIGGMTTALMLAGRGVSVTIYERSDRLGGRLAYQEGGEFRIDRGPTIVLLPETILEVLAECGIGREELELLPCDPMYRIHYADGTAFNKWRSMAKQVEEIRNVFSKEEGEGFERYMNDMGDLFRRGKKAFLERTFLRKRDFYTVRNLGLLAKVRAYRSVRDIASRYFRSEKLRDAFSLQTLYIGGAPFQVPGLYTLLPYAEHAFGVWYLKGGNASLAGVLEKELRRQGVTIHLNHAVTELIVEGKNCTGLVSGGERRMHDAVVYNGDFPGMASLLPKRQAKATPFGRHRGREYVPSSGCLLLYIGTNRRWPASETHQFFLSASLTEGLREVFEKGMLPAEPSFYVFNPSRIDEDAAPPGKSVLYVLVPVPSGEGIDWSSEAGPLADCVLEQAEARGFEGLRDSIEWLDMRTPDDARRDGLYRGGSFGIAPILSQSALFRPQVVPYPIAGLYAVGASLHPGGGIPIVMQGARLLVNQMEKEMKAWSSKPRSRSASL